MFAAKRQKLSFAKFFSEKSQVMKNARTRIAVVSLLALAACARGERDISGLLPGPVPSTPSPAPTDAPNVNPRDWSFEGLHSIDAVSSTSMRLNWLAREGASFYVVYRLGPSSPKVEAVVLPSVTSYTVSGLATSTSYSFRVRAANVDGVLDINMRDLSATTGSVPPLALSAVEPPLATSSGGSTVEVHGQEFQSGAVASIGGLACATSTVVSASLIRCVVPRHPRNPEAERVDVRVENPDGSSATLAGGFAYVSEPLLWLDAAQSSKFYLRAGNQVVEWQDSSGYGNHAWNDRNDSSLPLLNSASSAKAINGRSTVSFRRSDSTWLKIPPLAPLATALSSSFTAFVVSRVSSHPAGQGRESASVEFARPGYQQFFRTSADGTAAFGLWNTSDALFEATSAAGAIAQARVYLKTMVFEDADTIRGFVDGTEVANSNVLFSGPARGNVSGVPYYLGAASSDGAGERWHFTGEIAEVIFLPGALDDDARVGMENVLMQKWGLH